MKVLLTGATGLIGSAIRARLLADGHDVVALARHVPRDHLVTPQLRWVARELARMQDAAPWQELLRGVDAVVNCAGLLQDSPGERVEDVHARSLAPLFDAVKRQEFASSICPRSVSTARRRAPSPAASAAATKISCAAIFLG